VLRDATVEPAGTSRRRIFSGVAVLLAGANVVANGISNDSNGVVALGVLFVAVAAVVLGPVIAVPMSTLVGAPIARIFGTAGQLARQNARRAPRRTAASAAALMVGVSLVVAATIFGASLKASISDLAGKEARADYVVNQRQDGSVVPLSVGMAQVGDKGVVLAAGDTHAVAGVVDMRVRAGRFEEVHGNAFAVQREVATSRHWAVGDTVPFTFAETGTTNLRLAAIYDSKLEGDYWIGRDTYAAHFPVRLDVQVLLRTDGRASRSAIETVVAGFPSAKLQTRAEFIDEVRGSVDQLVGLVYILLFLALFIALVGIVNTLALSVIERTREMGLLRAVGMTHRQIRAEVRSEATIIALQGVAIGLALGVLFGWVFTHAYRDQGFDQFTIPVAQLIVITVVGGLTGVIAAVLPARRAARVDVLAAIATQ
jgi:putative ABC transport system permease protein